MIKKLLVANRGEIASRVFRTARALDIATVAVFSDADAHAPFVADADEAVRLPGNAPSETYLRGDLLIEAAKRTGADAVHPGYGFLSENAGFARDCAAAGLVFVGPPPEAIDAMGSKITAKRLMAAAGVPVLPGATVDDSTDLAAVGDQVGFPLLVKAAYGGGGRGMRVVRSASGLADAVSGARREAASAFGDGTVFLERYVEAPRHIEVQIFGDTHGNLVHLFERECSIQRRHQKIIEEAPSPAVDEALRTELGQAAVAAGKAIGYVGAGTVEFVVESSGGPAGSEGTRMRFYFLEVNTRLQVEHPVTELVTGLDLVEQQLRVADGDPLPAAVLNPSLTGHAVEARLYAEDVAAGFLPATGILHRFTVPDGEGIRVDAGVANGSEVGTHYDPMLAKVIGYGPTRASACRRLARALADSHVHGVVTNRDLLAGILREPDFRAGDVHTGYLTTHDPAVLAAGADQSATRLHAVAAALAAQASRRQDTPVLTTLPSGWRNVPNAPQTAVYHYGDESIEVRYRLTSGGVEVEVGGMPLDGVVLWSASATQVDLEVDGVRRAYAVHQVGDVSYVDSGLGASVLVEEPRFPEPGGRTPPGSLLAPMPGTVVRVVVEVGEQVAVGAPMVVLEAMKMEHTIAAPTDGTVAELHVSVGEGVDLGTVLAVVEAKS